TVVKTDRVTDESRNMPMAGSPATAESLPVNAAGIGAAGIGATGAGIGATGDAAGTAPQTNFESTDLETTPDLEGTNLDLITPGLASGAAAIGGMAIAANGLEADADEDDEDWDDDPNLVLEEALPPPDVEVSEPVVSEPIVTEPVVSEPVVPEPVVAAETVKPDIEIASAVAPPPVAEIEDFWNMSDEEETSTVAASPAIAADLSNLDAIDPTPDMIVAETGVIPDIEPNENTIIGESAVIGTGATAGGVNANVAGIAAAGMVTGAASTLSSGQSGSFTVDELASVDEGLPDLPEGYGVSRIVLLPRDPKWAYTYWDVSNDHKEELRRQGGERLMLRLYDVTDIDLQQQTPHGMNQQICHEMARSWYIEVPVSDRDYITEIGYLTADERWLMLARSAPIRVPPIYPSDWVRDQFVTVDWNESLAGRTYGALGHQSEAGVAADETATDLPPAYDELFALSQRQDALRVAGSLFGSQQLAPGALSASGGGLELAAPGLNMSGLNVSGLTMSGAGSGGALVPERSRKFWLIADAELIVYGATEPDATLTVGDRVIPLSPDGTFRFHVAFPDGQIDYPIQAVAADGEQSRSVSLHFERETPERNTNTQADAQDEWF
ncbi:MAG: DUF4912 domain-containing protein, partial [Phormidesmis sp.]